MSKYNKLCTPEQTIQAYRLGAPIGWSIIMKSAPQEEKEGYVFFRSWNHIYDKYLEIPTTQQMLGWLETKGATHTTHDTDLTIIDNSLFCLKDIKKERRKQKYGTK